MKLETLKILVQTARIAQKTGVLSLEDAQVVCIAVKEAETSIAELEKQVDTKKEEKK